MKCPKCAAPMEAVDHQQTQVDRCTNCGGLWFDPLELDDLLNVPGSETIDPRRPLTAEEPNVVRRFLCPKCESPLIRMVHARQSHVGYEQCSICGGLFLDAGEFRDLKNRTLLDLLRDLFTPERR